MTIANSSGESMQPCLTPVSTLNHSLVSPLVLTAFAVLVEILQNRYYLLWKAVHLEEFPKGWPVYTLKGFAKVNEVENSRVMACSDCFQDLSQCEYLIIA